MAKAIDKVRAAFGTAKRKITIPEWENLELYFAPLTTADMQAVAAREPKDYYERNLILVIHKALDADNKPAFQMGDLHYLRSESDYVVLERVIRFMFETAALSEKEATKQIEGDPSSASV